MKTILIILWCLIGLASVWRIYHGILKEWYDNFNESYWDFNKRHGFSAIMLFLLLSPILAMGGLITLFLGELTFQPTWYFTTKNIKDEEIY